MTLGAAPAPRANPSASALLVVDATHRRIADDKVAHLGRYLGPGDVLVVNDAATVPASLAVRTRAGRAHELRLTSVDPSPWVFVFGPGDWRTPTELREAPDSLAPGDVLRTEDGAAVTVLEVSDRSPRLVRVALAPDRDALLERLYRLARPIQYAYLERSLQVAQVQTPLATRPVAVEAPSAAYPLSWSLIASLRRRGVRVVALTHAAGLSATSDPALDATLPAPEHYELPQETIAAIGAAHRVIAAGTTVVRALEGNFRTQGRLVAGPGRTNLVIAPGFVPRVIDGVLSGVHDDGSSHHRIVAALLPGSLADDAIRHAASRRYLNHEYGDSMLILPGSLAAQLDAA